jgi:hypothetical protein
MGAREEVLRLLDPEAGLRCLPRFWKDRLAKAIERLSDGDLEIWLSERLRVIELHVEPLAKGPFERGPTKFSELCETLFAVDRWEDVASQFEDKSTDGLADADWLRWAEQTTQDRFRRLYCLTAHWAAMPPPEAVDINIEAETRRRIAELLAQYDRQASAVAVIEHWLSNSAKLI